MTLVVMVSLMSPVNAQWCTLDDSEFQRDMEELRKPRYTEVLMEVSYYTANDEGMDGLGITTSGTKATEGRTVAMSTQYLLGTRVIIDGHEYVNEDRGGHIVGNRIDVFCESRETAMIRGRHMTVVRIVYE